MQNIEQRQKDMRKLVNSQKTQYDKLFCLEDKYKNCKCIIFSCGESLETYLPHAKTFQEKGYIIVAVKKAYNKLLKLNVKPDFHILNFCNEIKYDYTKSPNTVSLYTYRVPRKKKGKSNYDIFFNHTYWEKKNILTGIQQNKDMMSFQKVCTKKELKHHWGDIMNELGLPICIHIGATEIYAAGWDCTNLWASRSSSRNKRLRTSLDKLQLETSSKTADFLQKHFNCKLRLIGEHSALKIPKVDMSTLI